MRVRLSQNWDFWALILGVRSLPTQRASALHFSPALLSFQVTWHQGSQIFEWTVRKTLPVSKNETQDVFFPSQNNNNKNSAIKMRVYVALTEQYFRNKGIRNWIPTATFSIISMEKALQVSNHLPLNFRFYCSRVCLFSIVSLRLGTEHTSVELFKHGPTYELKNAFILTSE